jgi:hypothetical protein
VDIVKLREYCLNPLHPRGRHKARVFASALKLHQGDAEFLRARLLEAALAGDAGLGEADEYGQRYSVDFECAHGNRRTLVRSAWIVLNAADFPRLLTCYVLFGVGSQMADFELLSVIALTEDLPAKGLLRGQVGTIVENLPLRDRCRKVGLSYRGLTGCKLFSGSAVTLPGI